MAKVKVSVDDDEMPYFDLPKYEIWIVVNGLGVEIEVRGLKRAQAFYDVLRQHYEMLSPRPPKL